VPQSPGQQAHTVGGDRVVLLARRQELRPDIAVLFQTSQLEISNGLAVTEMDVITASN
jgi:hypothetical protein